MLSLFVCSFKKLISLFVFSGNSKIAIRSFSVSVIWSVRTQGLWLCMNPVVKRRRGSTLGCLDRISVCWMMQGFCTLTRCVFPPPSHPLPQTAETLRLNESEDRRGWERDDGFLRTQQGNESSMQWIRRCLPAAPWAWLILWFILWWTALPSALPNKALIESGVPLAC